MTLLLNQFGKNSALPAGRHGGRFACGVAGTVALALSALACSGETPASTPPGNAGTGGQLAGGTGGTGMVAGTSSNPTGGTPTAMGGAAGMPAASGSATDEERSAANAIAR